MHTVPHWCEVLLQLIPHIVPLQVAAPPLGAGQAVHEVVPQLETLLLETQMPLHLCVRAAHIHVESRLSGVPLQSLSRDDVQSRVFGATSPTQVVPQELLVLSADSVHVRVPGLHGAVLFPEHVIVVFAAHAQLESLLSTVPLQSLSRDDVQSRVVGATTPVQVVLHEVLVLSADKTQVFVPALQGAVLFPEQGIVVFAAHAQLESLLSTVP